MKMNTTLHNILNASATFSLYNEFTEVYRNETTDTNQTITDKNHIFNDIILDNADELERRVIVKIEIIRYLYLAIGSTGILCNVFVLLVFLASRQLRRVNRVTNIYIINQSILDGLVSVFLVFGTLYENQDGRQLSGFWDDIYCRLWLSKLPLWSVFVSSTYNLVVINMERYIGILHPFWHKAHFNRKMVTLSVAFVWLIGPIYNIAFTVPTTHVKQGECLYLHAWSPLSQRLVGILTAVIQFFLPVTIHVLCCIRIVRFLHTRAGNLDRMTSAVRKKVQKKQEISRKGKIESMKGETENGDINKETGSYRKKEKSDCKQMKIVNKGIQARNQVLKMLLLMVFCFIFCWVWNQIYYFLFNLGLDVNLSGIFYHFTVIAVYVNCFTNPIVYMVRYNTFQSAVKQIFCRCLIKEESIEDSMTLQTNNTSAAGFQNDTGTKICVITNSDIK